MAEQVNTGGLMSIVYKKHEEERDPEFDKTIEEAYEKAGRRKKKEKILKIGIVILIILILGLAWFLLR